MSRRSRNRQLDAAEAVIKIGIFVVALFSFAIGGLTGFVHVFLQIGITASALIAVAIVVIAVFQKRRTGFGSRGIPPPAQAARLPRDANSGFEVVAQTLASNGSSAFEADRQPWNERRIIEALEKIDWYQFEKFNAAILSAEGWNVQRTGGARPDGGKDIIARRNGHSVFVQCKHWRTWKVQEKVVRELIGSMSIAGIASGAIHALNGFTDGARLLAASSGVLLHDGPSLARRAYVRLSEGDLSGLLAAEPHLCPKCESTMVLRTGRFDPFWGCSRYPQCRGKIEFPSAQVSEP
jgi:hypothetical protein